MIRQISCLVLCIFSDLVNPGRENNAQIKNRKVISIADVRSPDLPVACYAARFQGNG